MSETVSRPNLRSELSGEAPPAVTPPDSPKALATQAPSVRQLKHHEMCPGIRGKECACAANLTLVKDGTYKPLETKRASWKEPGKVFIVGCPECTRAGDIEMSVAEFNLEPKWCAQCALGEQKKVPLVVKETRQGLVTVNAELWRLDDGETHVVTRANPNSPRQKPIQVEVTSPPRWVCTRCGFSMRGDGISHRCDLAAVALATRVSSLADGLTAEETTDGTLRLSVWRDKDGVYHLAEELVRDGQVVKMLERDKDITYGVIEGALLGAVVDLWS